MATLEDFTPHILNSTTVTSNLSSATTNIATTTAGVNSCTFTSVLETSSITAVAKALEASSFITTATSASTVDSIVDKIVNSLDLNDTLIGNNCNPIAKDLKSISSRSSSVTGSLTLGGLGGGNMFSEVFESNVGSELESGSLEDSSGSLCDGDLDKNCKICRLVLKHQIVSFNFVWYISVWFQFSVAITTCSLLSSCLLRVMSV